MKRTGSLVCGLIAGEIYILFKDVFVLPVACVVFDSVLKKLLLHFQMVTTKFLAARGNRAYRQTVSLGDCPPTN